MTETETTTLTSLDATAQAELVRNGDVSPTELVEAAISRVEQVNPELNAVIHELFEEGRAEAESADLPDGPFKGVPFLFKDLGAAYAGQPMHLGMRLLKEADFRAPMDSYLAERFRAAGFVVIGKTNTPELGILPTSEPVAYGATRNPWNTEHTSGGSSGGSGAAVASGMVPVAHANDGGGSIRIPASINGLVGLKTTRQRTTEGPMIGDMMGGLTVELAVTRTVRDTASILDAVHGPAPGDPYAAPQPVASVRRRARGGADLPDRLRRAPRGSRPRVAPGLHRGCARCARPAGRARSRGRGVLAAGCPDGGGAQPRGHLPHPLGRRPGGDPRSARGPARPRRSPPTTSSR